MPVALALVALFATQTPDTTALVGKWGAGGQVLLELRADGTGVAEGEAFTWQADGEVILLTSAAESEVLPYTLVNGSLVIAPGGVPVPLERMGKAAPAPRTAVPASGPKAKAPSPSAKVPLKDPLAKLLLSSAWCSFSYNQTSGYSSSERFQFSADGSYRMGRQGEGYSSGGGGTWASQSNSARGGQWTVQKGTLHMSLPPEQPALAPLAVQKKKSSNGTTILVVNGVEYSPCE